MYKDHEVKHDEACKTVSYDDMDKKVIEAIKPALVEMEKQFYYFKDNGICIDDFLTYLLNIVCRLSIAFIENSRNAEPTLEYQHHVMFLIKGLCRYHGIDIVDHRFEEDKPPMKH